MNQEKIVIALGGNALGNNAQEQKELVKHTVKPIADLIEAGHQVVLTHGNGPQVGMINLAFENVGMPFPECGAMSQGYIGYHLQNALEKELKSRNIEKGVATVVTQVVVDKDDQAFQNPTKPIGAFYSQEEAIEIEKEKGFVMREDSNRGYRRMVPSPKPMDIVEMSSINSLIEAGNIVICCGGGGIPVVKENGGYEGVAAVIDKDFAGELLAEKVNADYLIILTAVEKVALNYGTPDEKWLDSVSVEDMKQYAKEGHFAPGSMLPKIEACIKFSSSKEGRKSLITALEKVQEGIEGKTGTVIVL